VQMNGKGAIVKMLQRRLGVPKEQNASVGDSMGDAGMFAESGCAVLFNPWDDRPRALAHHVIEHKDLGLVLDLICEQFGLQKPSRTSSKV
ncbi:MAG TPA: HAD hydrolase family protein, partial [Candidatus Poseidonia sp.]|nr:HAD hydrolase family protein [Poseidonia sp.]